MPSWMERLFMLLSFGLTDWANSPKMLRLEIRRPALYRAIVYPPLAALIAAYATLAFWCLGLISF